MLDCGGREVQGGPSGEVNDATGVLVDLNTLPSLPSFFNMPSLLNSNEQVLHVHACTTIKFKVNNVDMGSDHHPLPKYRKKYYTVKQIRILKQQIDRINALMKEKTGQREGNGEMDNGTVITTTQQKMGHCNSAV